MAIFKNHILVPIDFSEQSLIALGQSVNFARITKASLTLIYVIEDHFHLPFVKPKEDKSLEKNIKKELEKISHETHLKHAVNTDFIIAHGKVYEEIQKAARKQKSSLIIMGTNGSVGLKRFIGSNALRVIREAPCAVITIKGKKHRPGCKNILLPLDVSKETKEKISKAIELANLYGSHIYLMSVLTTDDEFIVNKLKRQMASVENFIKEHNVSCSHEFVTGNDVAEEISKYAKKIKADLVILMTQKEMGWTDMFLSDEAQEVLNETDVPVLSIRPDPRKTTTLSAFEY
jgi:nucleotide-binding universal stress UspA family protein